MSDNFERLKTDILRRTADDGGPTALDLLNAIEATNDDNDADHAVIMARLDKKRVLLQAIDLKLDDHIVADRVALSAIESRLIEMEEESLRVAQGVAQELTAFRALPKPSLLEGEVWYSYKLVKWAAIVAIVAVLGWGLPFWADSCATRNAEKIAAPEPPAHILTPTPSP